MPQRRAAINTQPVETERVELEPGAETEALQDVLLGFAGGTHQEKSVRPFDAAPLGFADRLFDLRQRLPLVEAVQDFLRARFDAEGQKIAVRLAHDGQLIHRDGIHAAFAAPLERELVVNDVLANRADAVALQQEMIVGQINRAVALVVELLHFAEDMLRRPKTPFAIGQRGDVAINAGVRTAARRLHGAEFFQRKNGRHVERQRFNVINRQRRPVGIRKLVQILDDRAGDVLDDFPAIAPDETGHACWIVQVVKIVRQKFFAFAHAHGVNAGTILQNPLLVHRGKNSAADDRNIWQLALDHLGHALHSGISRRGQKREGHDVRRVVP